jgi:hypothetical protein
MGKRAAGWKVADFSSCNTWSEADCGLCKLLLSIRPDSENRTRYHLIAFSARMAFFPKIPQSNALAYLKEQEGLFFGMVPAPCQKFDAEVGKKIAFIALCPQDSTSQDDVHVRLVQKQPDYQLLRHWISECENNSHWGCKPTKSSHRPRMLIDCQEGKVIPAPTRCSYVALSYVWDKLVAESIDPPSLGSAQPAPLDDLSKTIEDAMKVTLKLGERYLWVDKRCLDQNRPKDEIQSMSSIYGQAKVAIFAAAGEDEKYGLPGVSSRPRRRQATALIKGIQFASTLKHPFTAVTQSRWSERCWTHPEAVLCPRRLFFTEVQVYFMCNGMDCWESLHVPMSKLHRVRGTRLPGAKMPFKIYNPRHRHRLCDYMEHVQEYTSRNLSHEENSFDAFAGIAGKFESASPPIDNLWGVPIVSGQALESFTHALTWVHTAEDNTRSIKRRQDFPSYSFVGWEGTASMVTRKKGSKTGLEKFNVIGINIQVTTTDGKSWDISRFRLAKTVPRHLMQLRIEAWVMPQDIWGESASLADPKAMHFEVMIKLGPASIRCRAEVSGKMTDRDFLEGIMKGELYCFLLGYVDPKSGASGQSSRWFFLMLVRRDQGETVERIGILSFRVPRQQDWLLGLRKEKREFCFASTAELEQRKESP